MNSYTKFPVVFFLYLFTSHAESLSYNYIKPKNTKCPMPITTMKLQLIINSHDTIWGLTVHKISQKKLNSSQLDASLVIFWQTWSCEVFNPSPYWMHSDTQTKQNQTRNQKTKQKTNKKTLVYQHSQHHRKLRVGGEAGRMTQPIF